MFRRLLLGALAASLGWTNALSGQTQQTEAELIQQLDSLRPLLERAEAELQAYEAHVREVARSWASEVARVDTVRVGQVRIITPVEQVEAARNLFAEVWEHHFASVDHSPALDEVLFTFQWSDARVPIFTDAVGPHGAVTVHPVEYDSRQSRAVVEARIRSVLALAVSMDLSGLGTDYRRWDPGNPLDARSLESAYRIVAMTQSQASRACLSGDIDACASAMGLGTATGVRQIEDWYSPNERWSLIARTYAGARMGRNSNTIAACLDERSIEHCDQILVDAYRDLTPYRSDVRATLVAHALEVGGQGSWSRLRESADMTPSEALEHASMVPAEELIASWLHRLVENRPDTYERLLPKSGLTMLWALFFAALAMRSTRWRMG
jgi:hypothetical protein